jgi:hypothetical protein
MNGTGIMEQKNTTFKARLTVRPSVYNHAMNMYSEVAVKHHVTLTSALSAASLTLQSHNPK